MIMFSLLVLVMLVMLLYMLPEVLVLVSLVVVLVLLLVSLLLLLLLLLLALALVLLLGLLALARVVLPSLLLLLLLLLPRPERRIRLTGRGRFRQVGCKGGRLISLKETGEALQVLLRTVGGGERGGQRRKRRPLERERQGSGQKQRDSSIRGPKRSSHPLAVKQ